MRFFVKLVRPNKLRGGPLHAQKASMRRSVQVSYAHHVIALMCADTIFRCFAGNLTLRRGYSPGCVRSSHGIRKLSLNVRKLLLNLRKLLLNLLIAGTCLQSRTSSGSHFFGFFEASLQAGYCGMRTSLLLRNLTATLEAAARPCLCFLCLWRH